MEINDSDTSRKRIPPEIRLKYNEDRGSGSCSSVNSDVLLDVEFSFSDGKTKLRAHKLFLLDCPPSQFIKEKLEQNVGFVVIEVPNGIDPVAVDAILDFIYGKPLIPLWVTNHEFDFEGFLAGARFFQMEIMFLKQLVTISRVPNLRLQSYVSNNFQRLKTDPEFWNVENELILQLCRAIPLESEVVVDGFSDWIHQNHSQRRDYLDKLKELRRLIKLRLKNGDPKPDDQGNSVEPEPDDQGNPVEPEPEPDDQGNSVEPEPEPNSITPETEHSGGGGGNEIPSTTKETEQENERKKRKRSFVYDSVTDDDEDSDEEWDSNGHSSKITRPSLVATNEKRPSKLDKLFNIRLKKIQTLLNRKEWAKKEFSEIWTTFWGSITLANKQWRIKNEKRFNDGKGLDLLLESRRALQNEYSNYPAFAEAFINIVYHFSGDRNIHLINSDEILTYLLHDLNNPQNFKTHSSTTLAGQVLARILNFYNPPKWTLATSREVVSKQLKEAILNIWDLRAKCLDDIQKLSNLDELVYLISSKDPTARLCGLWLMLYHTKSDTTDEIRNGNAMKYVDYLNGWDLQQRIFDCINFAHGFALAYATNLMSIFGYIDGFIRKQINYIRTFIGNETRETKGFTEAWVSINKVMIRDEAKKVFLDENGITLLTESRHLLGKEYPKYPVFFSSFLFIIVCFSMKDSYAHFVFIDEIVEFILEDILRFDFPKDSVIAGEIAACFLRWYGPNDWHIISNREFVAARLKQAITQHWDFNVDFRYSFPTPSSFGYLLEMIKSNDTALNLFGVWMLTHLTKSDTLDEKRNKRAKEYVGWLKNTRLENFAKSLEQREDPHISGLAKQLISNLGFSTKTPQTN